MSFITNLFRSNKPVPSPASGVNVQSSIYGKPIPIVYGTTKIAGNMILYGNFVATSYTTGGGGKGGLFGGGSAGQTTQYRNSAAFAFALCEGPIQKVGVIWRGLSQFTTANLNFTIFTGTYPQAAWGTTVSWRVTDANGITTSGTSTPIGYNGIAYAASPSYNLNADTTVPNLQWEVFGILSNSVAGQEDADPSQVLNDFITNTHYGLSLSSSLIGDLTLWKNYCIATGMLVSPAYATQRTVTDMIDELMVATNSACFWSSGKLQVVPYGDQAITKGSLTSSSETDFVPNGSVTGTFNTIKVAQAATWAVDQGVAYVAGGSGSLTRVTTPPWIGPFGFVHFSDYFGVSFTGGLVKGQYYVQNGVYYFSGADVGAQVKITYQWAAAASFLPNVTPIYSLTDDDYMRTPQNNVGASASAGTAGPVLLTRKRKSDRINSVKIEYLDRQNSYAPGIAYAENQAEIDAYGKRTNGSKQLHLFCNATAANLSAHLQLRRELINNTYSFDLDQRYILLDPMDIIEISDSALGLSNQLVRITEIIENDNGTLSFTCEDALLGTGQAPQFSFAQQQGQPLVNIESPPGAINTPVFFEPPWSLNGDLEVWVAISGASNWGGADAWISTDGVNYALSHRINGGARMGVLTASLANVTPAITGQTIDQLNTLSVDLTQSNGTLTSASQQQATTLSSLVYVDGEYLAYATATLTATNKYNLTYLVRGAYNTTISAHASGTNFCRLDGQGILKIPFTQDRVGQTIYVKFLSFNQYGGGQGTLASATAYSYTILGTALTEPLANVTNLAEVFVGNLAELTWTEISDFRPVVYEVRVGSSWNNGQFLTRQAHPPFRLMGDGTYWVAAYSQPVANLTVYSSTPQGITVVGSNVTDNIFATREEDPSWSGSLSGAVVLVGNTVQSNGTGGGTYTIPSGDRIIITYPVACAVIMKWTSIGQSLFNSIFIYKGLANVTSGSATVTGMTLLTSTACLLNGGSTVTGISNTTGLTAGDPISGTGISTGTTILSIESSVAITMTLPATTGSTASPSTQSLTFYPPLSTGLVIQSTSTSLIPAGVTITSLISTDPSAAVMSTTALASSTTSTINVSIDFTQTNDLFGAAAVSNTSVFPFVRTSQDAGVTWSTWQRWVAGYYKGNAFDAQMSITTNDVNSVAVLQTWAFKVDVPDRVDHYPAFSISSAGSTLTFRPDNSITSTAASGSTFPFNGGQDASTKVTVLAAPSTGVPGTVTASNISLNSCLLNAYSSLGVAIAAAANVVVEGY